MIGASLPARTMERNRKSAAQPPGWTIWPGSARGYIAVGGDLPMIADALEALWFLRAQRREMDMLMAAMGGVLVPVSQ